MFGDPHRARITSVEPDSPGSFKDKEGAFGLDLAVRSRGSNPSPVHFNSIVAGL